jgi:hypothetical protein
VESWICMSDCLEMWSLRWSFHRTGGCFSLEGSQCEECLQPGLALQEISDGNFWSSKHYGLLGTHVVPVPNRYTE